MKSEILGPEIEGVIHSGQDFLDPFVTCALAGFWPSAGRPAGTRKQPEFTRGDTASVGNSFCVRELFANCSRKVRGSQPVPPQVSAIEPSPTAPGVTPATSPLSAVEMQAAVEAVKAEYGEALGDVRFEIIRLEEPCKKKLRAGIAVPRMVATKAG